MRDIDNEMNFRNVKELRRDYIVVAHFYMEDQCRLFADLVRNECLDCPIDAYILLINPGRCKKKKDVKKVEAAYYSKYEVVEAVSDPAQKCIMQLMDLCNLNKVRILNLSDKIEPKSNDAIQNMIKEGPSNSIFSDKRKDEFDQLMSDDAVIIIAWGMDNRLVTYKRMAMKKISKKKVVGILEDKSKLSYRYIKPIRVKKQKEVIANLAKMIK